MRVNEAAERPAVRAGAASRPAAPASSSRSARARNGPRSASSCAQELAVKDSTGRKGGLTNKLWPTNQYVDDVGDGKAQPPPMIQSGNIATNGSEPAFVSGPCAAAFAPPLPAVLAIVDGPAPRFAGPAPITETRQGAVTARQATSRKSGREPLSHGHGHMVEERSGNGAACDQRCDGLSKSSRGP